MKTIKIDDTEYISIDEHKKIIEEVNLIEKNKKDNDYSKSFEIKTYFVDDAKVIGIGNVEFKNDEYKFVTLDIDLLKRCIRIVEQVHYSKKEKEKRDSITLGISEDVPLLIGMKNDSKKCFSGVILAPRESY